MNSKATYIKASDALQGEIALPGGSRFIVLPNVTDERGSLCFAEADGHIPFLVKRVFWTYAVQEGCVRGNHAHRECQMVLFAVGGELTIDLDDGRERVEVRMDSSRVGVLIPPYVWSRQFDFDPQAACVCLASTHYEVDDYIYSYDEVAEKMQS